MSREIGNLNALLDFAADKFGERRFAVDTETKAELSFAGLQRQAKQIAAALSERFKIPPACPTNPGTQRSHVAILMPNCLEILPAYFGILRAGCVAVPVNARLKAEELQFILGDSDAEAVFVHPGTWKPAQEALAALKWNKPIIAVGFPQAPAGTIPFQKLLAHESTDGATGSGSAAAVCGLASEDEELDKESSGAARESTLAKAQTAAPAPVAPPNSSDAAAIIYTSGTTGRPKGAMLTHDNILYNVESTKIGHGLRGDDIHLLVVPLFHVTGLNTIMPTALEQGGVLAISACIDPEELLHVIDEFKCTTFFGVPTTFYLLSNVMSGKDSGAAGPAPTLRLICYSGAPMSAQTIQRLRGIFARVELHNFFGLTETTSVTTVLEDEQALPRAESVGRPPPGLDLCIMDESGKLLPAGEVGELCARGPSVFKGYYKRPQPTAEAMQGGWFHTGDTAYIDPQGYVFLRGRRKEMVIVAGENVYPIEVENVLCAHTGVQEAAVFGRPDAALGEVVHAAVVARPGITLTERELKAFLNPRLAAFKLPRTIKIVEKLPRNPSGKVLKREL